jgi:DNA replication initiation complex subunit (GINS family)
MLAQEALVAVQTAVQNLMVQTERLILAVVVEELEAAEVHLLLTLAAQAAQAS